MLEQQQRIDQILTFLPNRPYCSDDLAYGLRVRPRESAKAYRYLQINSPAQHHYLIFDVDRQGAAYAWEDCAAPPNYAAINPENGHAHLVYKLNEPVVMSEFGRLAPKAYLESVEKAYRVVLGADTGYKGLVTRNPYKTHTLCLRSSGYDLFELSDWLKHDLGHYKEREVIVAGVGRNVTLFDTVRNWAYKAVRFYRVAARSRLFEAWLREVESYSEGINIQFHTPLSHSEVRATAKSIAKYCWKHDVEEARKFSQKQSIRGRMGGKASGIVRARSNDNKRVQARLLSKEGYSQRAIAKELSISVGSVNAWLK